jgi:hypothetical protein
MLLYDGVDNLSKKVGIETRCVICGALYNYSTMSMLVGFPDPPASPPLEEGEPTAQVARPNKRAHYSCFLFFSVRQVKWRGTGGALV